MKLSDILKKVVVEAAIGDLNRDITGVNMDSRQVEAGDLFVAVKGTQTDGHAYIGKAIELGAKAIACQVVPEETVEGVTYLQYTSTDDCVGPLATTFVGEPTKRMKLIGVTGTNGKTTIATVLYDMFRHLGYKCGLCSTVCNYIDGEAIPTECTTPDPITLNRLLGRMADEGCEYAFMEVSSHSVAQQRIGGLPVVVHPVNKSKLIADTPSGGIIIIPARLVKVWRNKKSLIFDLIFKSPKIIYTK